MSARTPTQQMADAAKKQRQADDAKRYERKQRREPPAEVESKRAPRAPPGSAPERKARTPKDPHDPKNDGGFFHAIRDGANWLKNQRVVSSALRSLAGKTSGKLASVLESAGNGARQLGLGRRRRVGRPRQRGRGFFSDVGNWFKGAANTVAHNGLISKAANLASNFVPGPAGMALKTAGNVAGQIGLGRRRVMRKRRIMKGRGFFGDIYKYGKDTKILSKLADTASQALPGTAGLVARMISSGAKQAGLGRRRRVGRPRKQRGGYIMMGPNRMITGMPPRRQMGGRSMRGRGAAGSQIINGLAF